MAKQGTGTHAKRSAPGITASDQFEVARRFIVKRDKLETKVHDAREARFNWLYLDNFGRVRKTARRATNADEREEIKRLEAALVDAKTHLFLHEKTADIL